MCCEFIFARAAHLRKASCTEFDSVVAVICGLSQAVVYRMQRNPFREDYHSLIRSEEFFRVSNSVSLNNTLLMYFLETASLFFKKFSRCSFPTDPNGMVLNTTRRKLSSIAFNFVLRSRRKYKTILNWNETASVSLCYCKVVGNHLHCYTLHKLLGVGQGF